MKFDHLKPASGRDILKAASNADPENNSQNSAKPGQSAVVVVPRLS
ncbi:hypothetical protein [Mesorhizobium sp. M4A.F.Ca.ET.090.04.2.1]|nr:hypothetical protein [Mesorhizobium sp. M4A.F.Ca.ET.090.04.2.1]